uniref:WAP four-disulfide core domain 2 n=1 Tax=Sinocyclocheilus rhinocerous TaxID=307959 RepID=A0A673JCJ1_9TELE
IFFYFYRILILTWHSACSGIVSLSCICITAKPGVCPRRKFGAGMCAEFCVNDSDCPNNEKCCSNGCGHECMAPYTAKPGVCPRRKFGAGMCAEFCVNDSDCPNNEKCCSNGYLCFHPLQELGSKRVKTIVSKNMTVMEKL